MLETITIAGRPFTISNRYSEGHTCTANEADALNQTMHENVRNNLAEKLKKIDDDSEAQALVDSYSADYIFGARGGGGSRDPVQTEAMNLARGKVKAALQRKGHKVSGEGAVSAKRITELAGEALAKHPEWLDTARQIVAAKRSAADETYEEEIGIAAE